MGKEAAVKRCENCGLVMPDNSHKGPYKYFCTNNGKRKRAGDSCGNFWEKEEMKNFIDEATQYVK